MQRGDLWIGDVYSADLVVYSLSQVGRFLEDGLKVLDYGGSSGSCVRILAAAYPEVWFASCDPSNSSISWARECLQRHNLKFFHQDQIPPLPFRDKEFDVIYAISIFSHHGINASKRWFNEISRILKPGGQLVFTTHGIGSILHYTLQKQKPLVRFKEMYAAYLATGFVFEEVWIDQDDIGNTATAMEWGNSYYSQNIIALLIHEDFDLLKAFPRLNQSNQDVYVVRKRLDI